MSERARPPDDIPPGEFFTRWIGDAVAEDPDRRSKLGGTEATVEFELTGNPAPVGTWTVEITGGTVSGREGVAPEADLQVRVDEGTWRDLNAGRISAPEALLRRRIHVRGSFLLALKLHLILG
jgi:putative sterol carrier protein